MQATSTTSHKNKQYQNGYSNAHVTKTHANAKPSQAKLRPDILCVIGAPNQTQLPISPSSKHTMQFIEGTYCHDRFLEQAITNKHAKYDPLISTIQNSSWNTNPLITITARVKRSHS
jgi:hypothetical protein